ncbi:manganese catalase family protein [Mycoplasmatota bacterium WC44]
MWLYVKSLQFPVNIKKKDLRMANYIVTQYGGPDGELGAAIRYLNQRYTMPTAKGKALLTDIGTEELGHVEMIQTMVYQLIKGATIEELKEAGLANHYTQHNHGIFPTDTNGVPFNVGGIGSTGDPIADLHENLAAEQKARATYEHLMDLTDDPDLLAPLEFLRQREIIHYQRFGEYLNELQQMKEAKK